MHAQARAGQTMQQRHKRLAFLEERAPALINLPFPIPSIPLLDPILKPLAPILTPIIDGQHLTTATPASPPHTTSTSPTQAPAPAPAPTTAPSAPAPSSPPSSGNSPTGGGSSGGGSSQGGDSSGSSPSGGGGSSGGGSSSGDGSPSGSGGSGGSSNVPGNGANNSPPPNASAPPASSSGPPSATSVNGGLPPGGSASASSAALSGVSGTDGQPGTDSANSSDGSASSHVFSAVMNANGAAFISGTSSSVVFGTAAAGVSVIGSAGFTTPTGIGVSSGKTTGSTSGLSAGTTPGTTGDEPSGPGPTSSNTSVHHGLSTGIIVAIAVISAVLALLLLLFCCRRRAIAMRLRRRKTWFTAGAYGAGIGSDEYRDKDVGGAGSRSARSSFATNFDRGQMISPVPEMTYLESRSEMSQVWPSNLSGSISVPPASHNVESSPSPTVRAAPDRTSIGSTSSAGSRPPSQTSHYLAVPSAAATPYALDCPSPFSVRPFSPTETFAFPRPPQDDARSRASGAVSGSSVDSAAFFTVEEQTAEGAAAENPFLDPAEVRPPSATSDDSGHFAPVEFIQRPFVPTMDDEMGVVAGDQVRIVKRFDDGWAYAENAAQGMQGLIPIDCLRPVEEDLPAFLAKKRLSSYGAAARHLSQRASVVSGGSAVGKAM